MSGSACSRVANRYAEFQSPFDRDEHAKAAILHLKTHGFWTDDFDHLNFPAMFSELPRPTVDLLVDCLKGIMKSDPTGTFLSARAKYYARAHDLKFGEVLSALAFADEKSLTPQSWAPNAADVERNRQTELSTSKAAVAAGLLTQEMSDLAWKYANSEGVSFKLAIAHIAQERPELFAALSLKQIERQAGQWGHAG